MARDLGESKYGYSIGVGPQIKWDEEMAQFGLSIYQYDHTVEGLPTEHENFTYHKLGIAAQNTLPDLITLNEMLKRNGHSNQENLILKIDVEGAEWDVFDALDVYTLSLFDQIIIEFHGLRLLFLDDFRNRARRVFQKLNHSHTAAHVHANNYGGMHIVEGIAIPDVVELLYCKRTRFDFLTSSEIFPTALDEPCKSDEPDLFLGPFRFKCLAA